MDDYLPRGFGQIPKEMRFGRSIHDGYQRGWGLEFGDLKAKVAADPDFIRANALAQDRTAVRPDKLMNLFLLLKFYLPRIPFGHIIEFGAYRGGSAMFMASVAKTLLPHAQVYALDTFTGMPRTDKSIDAHSEGDFGGVDLAEITSAARTARLDNLHFVKGMFADTLPSLLRDHRQFALAHIDCDIFDAVDYSYRAIRPSMVMGGYYVFDDSIMSSCLGATEVVERTLIQEDGLLSEQIYPHHVFRAT